jgi:hypothetical protein
VVEFVPALVGDDAAAETFAQQGQVADKVADLVADVLVREPQRVVSWPR